MKQKQIFVQKTVKRKFISEISEIKFQTKYATQKNFLATKNTRMTENYLMNSGKLKLQSQL